MCGNGGIRSSSKYTTYFFSTVIVFWSALCSLIHSTNRLRAIITIAMAPRDVKYCLKRERPEVTAEKQVESTFV